MLFGLWLSFYLLLGALVIRPQTTKVLESPDSDSKSALFVAFVIVHMAWPTVAIAMLYSKLRRKRND